MRTFLSGLASLVILVGAIMSLSPTSANAGGSGSVFNFASGGSTGIFADGTAVYGGTGGNAFADQVGFTGVDIDAGLHGTPCGEPSCADVDGGLEAYFNQELNVGADGASHQSDTPAGVANSGVTEGLLAAFSDNEQIEVGANTSIGGAGSAVFSGTNGGAATFLDGYAGTSGTLNLDGLCPTCESASFDLHAFAGEHGGSASTAFSDDGGTPAGVGNLMQTNVRLDFEGKRD